jgi:hypothetical protein
LFGIAGLASGAALFRFSKFRYVIGDAPQAASARSTSLFPLLTTFQTSPT